VSERNAQCSCGQLKLVASGEPIRISVCHCLACQLRSGSAFAAQARFPRDQVKIEGQSSRFVRTGDSGNTATFYFCPTCGSTGYYEIDNTPDVVAIPLGAFADPAFPAPRFSVYESRRHQWVHIAAAVERFD
jgi:hypothetical protein